MVPEKSPGFSKKKAQVINPEYGRMPPQAIEIEEAILGAILLEPGSYTFVAHFLTEPSVFYKECNIKILEAIIELHKKNVGIDILTVTDHLRKTEKLMEVGGPAYITKLMSNIGSAKHLSFHCAIITDKYLLRELIRVGAEMQQKAYEEEDPKDIAEWAEKELITKFDLDIEGRISFKDALHMTLLDIANKAKGLVSTFIRTGDKSFDENITLRERQILLIAGAEGCGKTKYATYLAKGILDNNDNVRILWFSMEDSKEQIIRSFISMGCKLTSKQMQSINYTITADDQEKIADSVQRFGNYNIEFVDHVCTINTISRKAKQFRDKNPDDTIIIIVDNLGLINTESFYKGNEKDDYLAGRIKDISDQTLSSIIVLHHITKESAKSFNLAEGYRPRKEYIKGSTRILDYVQQAILVNLPRKYKDLVIEEKEKAKLFNVKPATGKFDFSRFINEFWVLNPHSDKNTKTIVDLREMTWEQLKEACSLDTLDNGAPMGVSYIMRKYIEYSLFIDDKNRHREQKYYEEKLSIYSFIVNKKYKEDFKPKQTTRTYYLYGNDIKLSLKLQHLFIVEAVKNRDGQDSDDTNIIRYEANLDYNTFEIINNLKDEVVNGQNEGALY